MFITNDTYKVAWIHDAIFNWMCAVHSVLLSRFLFLTATCSDTLASALGRYLGTLLYCRFLRLKYQ